MLDDANELMARHPLTAVRLHAWSPADNEARFEVFHIEWPTQVCGELRFREVSYLQCPISTTWGYRLRVASGTHLPSRGDHDTADVIYELFARDGTQPNAFVVAVSLECITHEARI